LTKSQILDNFGFLSNFAFFAFFCFFLNFLAFLANLGFLGQFWPENQNCYHLHYPIFVFKRRGVAVSGNLQSRSASVVKNDKITDIGRIYIKGYLYPIFYPKIAKKDIPLSFFEWDMLKD
jgi:hypothetical protein